MDFSKEFMTAHGHGSYHRLDVSLVFTYCCLVSMNRHTISHLCTSQLPPLFVAFLADPSDSGKIHNDVRKRFDAGDKDVHEYVLQVHTCWMPPSTHISIAEPWQPLRDTLTRLATPSTPRTTPNWLTSWMQTSSTCSSAVAFLAGLTCLFAQSASTHLWRARCWICQRCNDRSCTSTQRCEMCARIVSSHKTADMSNPGCQVSWQWRCCCWHVSPAR